MGNSNQNGPGPGQIQMDPKHIKEAPTVECSCGCKMFSEKLIFKKLSAFISPTGTEQYIPIPAVVCDKCGKVPEIFDTHNVIDEDLKTKIVKK